MSYSQPAGKTADQLYLELKDVYDRYPEYHERGFDQMVEEFAADNFYNLHFIAREYLKLEYDQDR